MEMMGAEKRRNRDVQVEDGTRARIGARQISDVLCVGWTKIWLIVGNSDGH
jgi:hypothetical protein